MAKKLHIKNFGCQMNVYDATRMVDVLTPLGYRCTEKPEDADLVILNTCHIREKAAEKIYSELGRLRAQKEIRNGGPQPMMIGVAGCVAQAEGAEMLRRAPYVDLVFGPQTYHRLPEMVARAHRAATDRKAQDRGIIDTEFPVEPKFDSLPVATSQGPSAFLTIQEGCDRFCAFCVVPYTRGAEFSRPVADVVTEARSLVAAGAREITLLGQNVNAYHGFSPTGGEWRLAALIEELVGISELARLRYTTSHPRDMSPDLIEAHGKVDVLMPYLHLPVQSGSDNVLSAMNRQHSAADYLAILDALRAARPDIALSSDFIVGHPGETDEDFEATLALVEQVGYAQAYSFKYSPRPGTPASAMEDVVPEAVKSERLARLQGLLNKQQIEFNEGFVGELVPVLLDRYGRRDSQLAGRSPWMQAVHVDFESAAGAQSAYGTVVDVQIISAHPNSLAAVPVNSARTAGQEPATV
ncbi:MAG TPA: tRNA (N6-isopentenyl adenosine(37)-C2)-methylthiotransferase MiaB [Rhodospirillaceae bacterium]|nr:tRNA (N6-isopentenyl adenosine(37)-C2)-methylthiotransferase MiaB [Rhodospirillaceae bacterium]